MLLSGAVAANFSLLYKAACFSFMGNAKRILAADFLSRLMLY